MSFIVFEWHSAKMQKKADLGESSVTYPLPVVRNAKGCKMKQLN